MIDPERAAYLVKRVATQEESGDRRTYRVQYRQVPIDPPVIRVDSSFPRYRLANGRTGRKQEEYLANHPTVPRDLFEDGSSDVAQLAQHEILVDMARQANLEEMLDNEGQREPLVLTCDGYVVNGNRRLAVLRKLGKTDYVDAVVLPGDAGPDDLAILEMRLQMAEDGKAPYNWVDELLTIQRNVERLKIPRKYVASAMHVYEKTIDLKLHQLSLVNMYLQELGHAHEHFRVDGDEQAFLTLARAHLGITDPAKQASLRALAFNVISCPQPGSSVHRQIETLVRGLDGTIALLVEEHGTEMPIMAREDDLLSLLDDDVPDPVVIQLPISAASAEAVHEAIDIAAGVVDEQAEAVRAAAALKQAAKLITAVQITSETASTDVILGQLGLIENRCAQIRRDLKRVKAVE